MDPDRPVYQTPGAMIRSAREARHLSLQDLAAETRIPDRLLAAIERDDYDQLSGALYARSFLRSCGGSLGLDPALLLESYERLLTEREPDVPADQTWEEEAVVQRVGGVPWRPILVVGAALAGLALIVAVVVKLAGGGGSPEAPASTAGGERTATVDVIDPEPGAEDAADAGGEDPRATGREDGTPAEADAASDGAVAPAPDALAALESLPRGDRSLVFDDGESWPLVLCVVTDRPLDFAVGSDGDREARDIVWPETPVHGVPEDGVVAGRLYTVGGRHVAYWGAADHFLLRLSRADGVTVVLNGTPLAIPERSVGREWVLDRAQLGP